jgi:tRNA A-37 threonylcarbamoyl transferase component Bud32
MEEKIIKELRGHSGSRILLMQENENIFVRKIGNIERNFERLSNLYSEYYPVPVIYQKYDDILDMEYLHGLDMKSYLTSGNINLLSDFIIDNLNKFAKNSTLKDYTEIYEKKLDFISETNDLPFTKEELITRLPKKLPSSNYHGDLTLENIIYSNNSFFMIDAVTIEYDSYIFDIAKLRQDLECKWFLRNSNLSLDVKLQNLQEKILSRFSGSDNDYLLILMLLRVYQHTKTFDNDRKFILKEINRLWK